MDPQLPRESRVRAVWWCTYGPNPSTREIEASGSLHLKPSVLSNETVLKRWGRGQYGGLPIVLVHENHRQDIFGKLASYISQLATFAFSESDSASVKWITIEEDTRHHPLASIHDSVNSTLLSMHNAHTYPLKRTWETKQPPTKVGLFLLFLL